VDDAAIAARSPDHVFIKSLAATLERFIDSTKQRRHRSYSQRHD
jgi:hypothetical protein